MTKTKKKRLALQRSVRDEEHRARRIAVFSLFTLFIFAVANFVVVSIWGERFLGGFPDDTPPQRIAIDPQRFDAQ